MARLSGKIALITGVSAGIGLAAARLFASEGAFVFGVDRTVEAGQTLAKELNEQGLKFEFFAADLSDRQTAIAVVEQCYQRYNRIDILYNNAGISSIEPFTAVTPETLEKLFAVNFMATFYLCQQVIPHMQQQKSGVIINTASELAIVAQPLYSAYCATKGAVLSLTRALALEYARENIRINALCPGPIDTALLNQEFEQEADPIKAKAESVASMPIGRLGTPEEIAQVALFLASDAPQLMQGAALLIDGGKTII
ncbi:SDR family NAD(P)-dependent oxidoreductase [Leptolyngbya sp. AN03gr2]|uniref:SDR family NAD(P)-dependent oxidoreductase n=1 Tax=unclassified Leptolyngbya TaxID=2650499 RepID=UPI003D313C12